MQMYIKCDYMHSAKLKATKDHEIYFIFEGLKRLALVVNC